MLHINRNSSFSEITHSPNAGIKPATPDESPEMKLPLPSNQWVGILPHDIVKKVDLSKWLLSTKHAEGTINKMYCINKQFGIIQKSCGLQAKDILNGDKLSEHLEKALVHKINAKEKPLTNQELLAINKAIFRIGCLINGIFKQYIPPYAPLADEQGNLPDDCYEPSRWIIQHSQPEEFKQVQPMFDGTSISTNVFYAVFNRVKYSYAHSENRNKLISAFKKVKYKLHDMAGQIDKSDLRFFMWKKEPQLYSLRSKIVVTTPIKSPIHLTALSLSFFREVP